MLYWCDRMRVTPATGYPPCEDETWPTYDCTFQHVVGLLFGSHEVGFFVMLVGASKWNWSDTPESETASFRMSTPYP